MLKEQIKIILLLGWRNVVRQKRRAFVSFLLIFISAGFLIFFIAMMHGQYGQMFRSAIEIYPGYIEITGKGYQDNPSYDRMIYDTDEVITAVEESEDVEDYTVRFETFALYSSGSESAGGMLIAIDPEREVNFSKIKESLIEGEYLSSNDTRVVYIGATMANRLNVKVGDELAFISTDMYYSIASDNVKVKGIFKTNTGDFDSLMVFTPKVYFDTLFVSENTASHVVIRPKDIHNLNEPVRELSEKLNESQYEVFPWQEYLKELVTLLELDRSFGYIMIGMFLIVIFFVIMIFTLISVHTRTKEIGIMRANGTTPNQVAAILFAETTIISIISILIGGIVGAGFVWYWNVNPIVINNPEMLAMTEQYAEMGLQWEPVIQTEFSFSTILENMATIFVMSLVAVLYPILRINKLKPVEAIAGGKG